MALYSTQFPVGIPFDKKKLNLNKKFKTMSLIKFKHHAPARNNFDNFFNEFFEGEFIAKEVYKHSVLIISPTIEIPRFRLDKERIFDRIAGMAGFEDIEIEGHVDFSRRFKLKGKNVNKLKSFFSNELVLFFESHPYYYLESNG